jgi:DNA repair exonuclease SbcCD ATPase subunit
LKHREEAVNPWHEEIDQVIVTCGELAAHVQAAQVKLDALDEEVPHVSFWHEFFSKELKLQLFESTCPFLAERTRYHLDGLRNPQIYAEFNTIKRLADGTPKDEFTVRVFSETGGDGFDSLSGGEQQIVSFAIGLALADLAAAQAEGSSSFLILDEPFSQLDARNSEAIVEYLTSDIGKTKETILLISNDDELKTLIPNRVHVIKRRGVSQIER